MLHTAISDLEVQATEEAGQLWHLRYPLASGTGHLVVATTRPETMLGDVAVAVHPDDDRYRHPFTGSGWWPKSKATLLSGLGSARRLTSGATRASTSADGSASALV